MFLCSLAQFSQTDPELPTMCDHLLDDHSLNVYFYGHVVRVVILENWSLINRIIGEIKRIKDNIIATPVAPHDLSTLIYGEHDVILSNFCVTRSCFSQTRRPHVLHNTTNTTDHKVMCTSPSASPHSQQGTSPYSCVCTSSNASEVMHQTQCFPP